MERIKVKFSFIETNHAAKMSSSEQHNFPSEGHSVEILRSTNTLRKQSLLCDAILHVEDRDFPVHRVILAACSDYFKAMFTNCMSESSSEQKKIVIKGLSADTMDILLDFIYTETIKVNVENVQALLPAACLLQLNGKQLLFIPISMILGFVLNDCQTII